MNKPIRKWLGCCLWLLILLPATVTALPTSKNPSMGDWKKMHPSSFAGTIASAVDQCQKDSFLDYDDPLTLESCNSLKEKLEAGECPVVWVPDGIVFDYLNGRQNGESAVINNRTKKLGRKDRALLCDLGNNLHIYWFTGVARQSCNNLAVVFAKVSEPVVIKTTRKQYCRYIQSPDKVIDNSSSMFASGFPVIDNCGNSTGFVPSTVFSVKDQITSGGGYYHCEYIEEKEND